MSVVAELLYSRRVPQVAVLALISFSFAGCSADMQSRLSQSNFSNPFASEQTGSVQQAPPPQRELPQYSRPQTQSAPYQSQPLPPPTAAPPSFQGSRLPCMPRLGVEDTASPSRQKRAFRRLAGYG